MPVLIYSHPSSHRHVTPPGHPERVARIEAIDALLASGRFAGLPRAEAPAATREQLERAHDAAYVDRIFAAAPAEGFASLDGDTHMSPGSLEAALHAAGSVVAATDAVLSDKARAAFCAVRPCGHHAERNRAMGFCLFANVAIGALHALEAHGLSRVAVLDFDVHHGNGTQDILESNPRAFFASSHQMPLFPGTGAASETGVGNVFNFPLRPLSGGDQARGVWESRLLPAMRDFGPEIVFVSAGFDAHRNDPLANLQWDDEDFGWITGEICRIAEDVCDGRIVSALEGGYDLHGLVGGLASHLDALVAHAEGA